MTVSAIARACDDHDNVIAESPVDLLVMETGNGTEYFPTAPVVLSVSQPGTVSRFKVLMGPLCSSVAMPLSEVEIGDRITIETSGRPIVVFERMP